MNKQLGKWNYSISNYDLMNGGCIVTVHHEFMRILGGFDKWKKKRQMKKFVKKLISIKH